MQINTKKLDSFRSLIQSIDLEGPPSAAFVGSPVDSPARCLVLDAAFNPPTVAHWGLARSGALASGASHVILQLSCSNVDKGTMEANLAQRLYMVAALATLKEQTSVTVCSHARFIDKANALAALDRQIQPIFAIGYDTLVRLFDPKYYEDMAGELEILFEKAEFVVGNRGDTDQSEMDRYLEDRTEYGGRIHTVTLDASFSDVSSSNVRKRSGQGENVRALVPEPVADLIKAFGLYT